MRIESPRGIPALLFVCSVLPAFARGQPLSAAGSQGAVFQLVQDGVRIDAGSLGTFTLDYPAPGPEAQHTYAVVEKRISGNRASLRYERGAIDLTLGADGTVAMTFDSMPADVRTIRMRMLIDYNFSDGGTWRAGAGSEQSFPAMQPARPYLFQGNVDRFAIKDGDGRTLTIEFPQTSFTQLQDNRAWNSKSFGWFVAIPYSGDTRSCRLKVSVGGVAQPKVRVDRFGQSMSGGYAGKVGRLAELKADAGAERRWLATIRPPTRDQYGGLPNSGRRLGLKSTGFFHVEQKGTKLYLVDPAGNAFFQLGVCSMGPGDDYTYVAGRRGVYQWLPAANGPFRTAFREGDSTAFSFHLANRIRKTGTPFDLDAYLSVMIDRARKWGFNSCGPPAFRPVQKTKNWPYIGYLPLTRWDGIAELPGVAGIWDPFDETNRRRIQELFAARIAPHANDSLVIGYFLANEQSYEVLPDVIPTLNSAFACKQRFVRALQAKYDSIDAFNRSWSAQAKSFDELIDRGLTVGTAAARQDVRDFVGQFLDEYFRLVADVFRRNDPHHLLLGNRLTPATAGDEQLCRVSAKYLDVVSINYYSFGIDAAFLSRVHGWIGNRPILLSEFYFNSQSDSRLTGGGMDVSSQAQRGLAYRNYVEQAAALGFIVGIEWFTLVDQSVTGRYFSKYNGEHANTGLISVADRPWRAMLDHMIRTNYGIYDVILGTRPPFVWQDARARAGAPRK